MPALQRREFIAILGGAGGGVFAGGDTSHCGSTQQLGLDQRFQSDLFVAGL